MNITQLQKKVDKFKPKKLSTCVVSAHERSIYSRPDTMTRDTKKLLSIYYTLDRLSLTEANKQIIKMICNRTLNKLEQ